MEPVTSKETTMPRRDRSASTSTAVVETADANLKQKFAALQREAVRSWREAATELANDGRSPRPEEVLRLGAILNIANPGETLEADAQAVRDMAKIEARIQRALRENAAMVEPWGGDRDRLLADINATEQRLKDMRRALLIGFDGASDWYGPRERLKRSNPRMFPQEARR